MAREADEKAERRAVRADRAQRRNRRVERAVALVAAVHADVTEQRLAEAQLHRLEPVRAPAAPPLRSAGSSAPGASGCSPSHQAKRSGPAWVWLAGDEHVLGRDGQRGTDGLRERPRDDERVDADEHRPLAAGLDGQRRRQQRVVDPRADVPAPDVAAHRCRAQGRSFRTRG